MRLRNFMLAVTALSALGAILLAADMYRRLVLAEAAARQATAPAVAASGANFVYGMAHVIGVAALAAAFLAVCLALIAEAQIRSAKSHEVGEESVIEPAAIEKPPESVVLPIPTAPVPATLVIFTRFPEEGRVKTRLIPAIGVERATKLATVMLKDLVDHLTGALDLGVRGVICFDPHVGLTEEARPQECEWCFRELLGNIPGALHRFEFLAQSSGPLGERLANAMRALQEQRREPMVFIGSDAPLDAAKIEAGLARARLGEAYLLPAEDGGYVMLALPAHVAPVVFDNIAWSTPETAKMQVEQIGRCALKVEVGAPAFFDVDEEKDLSRLKEFLAQNPGTAPRTAQALNQSN